MFKLCKWLIQYMVRPYKKFEHLIKCLHIFIKWAKQMSEKRKERLNRKRRKAYLAPRARPSPPPHPVVFPRQTAAQVCGAHADAGEHLLAWLAPLHRLLLAPRD